MLKSIVCRSQQEAAEFHARVEHLVGQREAVSVAKETVKARYPEDRPLNEDLGRVVENACKTKLREASSHLPLESEYQLLLTSLPTQDKGRVLA